MNPAVPTPSPPHTHVKKNSAHLLVNRLALKIELSEQTAKTAKVPGIKRIIISPADDGRPVFSVTRQGYR